MIRHVVENEANGQYEISKFSFDMALKIQEKIEEGEVIYNELKHVLGFETDSKIKSMASIQSKVMQKYFIRSAFRTFNEKVIIFVNL